MPASAAVQHWKGARTHLNWRGYGGLGAQLETRQDMRIRIATIVVALAAGCGGGGGGGVVVPPAGQALAKQILEDCGVDALGSLGGLIDAFFGIMDIGTPLPNVTVTGLLNDPATGFSFSIDLDGDDSPDITGTLEFFDAGGTPVAVADLAEVPANPDAFAGLLGVVPDGTRIRIDYTAVSGTDNGTITLPLQAGAAASMSGQVSIQIGNCSSTFTFTDVEVLIWLVPIATIEVEIVSSAGTLEGEATVDTSDVAAFSVTLDGGSTLFEFNVNMETGVATPTAP